MYRLASVLSVLDLPLTELILLEFKITLRTAFHELQHDDEHEHEYHDELHPARSLLRHY